MKFCHWCCTDHFAPVCWPASEWNHTELVRLTEHLPLACGDCERFPCRCDEPDDVDLAWLTRLADHDPVPTRLEKVA